MASTSRTVLVTGGAAGIGAAIAARFAGADCNVAVIDIDFAAARRTADALGAYAIQADVALEGDAERAVSDTASRFGGLDVLVNNAGIEVNGRVSTLTAAQWDRQIAVNLRGAFLFSKFALAHMGRGSSIVHISSIHGVLSWPDCAAYDATKSALIGLTRSMAIDHGPQGVRVNCICPGYIDTPLLQQWLNRVPDREAAMREVMAKHPVGRIGRPEDIAEAAFFLASEAASFISGAHLVVDGGLTVRGH